MPWIQNISRSDVARGFHFDPDVNSMLIQISDPPGDHPTPKYQFREVHQFDFLDIEEDGMTNFGDGKMVDVSEFAVTQADADRLVELLQRALENRMNVIVHCHAGVCRSGAVCEVGVMMGFQDTEVFRSPNLLVKHKMMRKLGWLYDEQEPHTINGVPLAEEWTTEKEKIVTLATSRYKNKKQQDNI